MPIFPLILANRSPKKIRLKYNKNKLNQTYLPIQFLGPPPKGK